MPSDESVTREGRMRAPRHRADCVDFYLRPQDTNLMDFRVPPDTINVLEEAAERANRTWNAQFLYVIEVCRGLYLPSADDQRTVRDWQSLMAEAKMRFREGEDWIPCRATRRHSMNFKQFRQPANGHNRTARINGRVVGGRGLRLMSKIGQNAISLDRLEQLLLRARTQGKDGAHGY